MCWEYSCVYSFTHLFIQKKKNPLSLYDEEGTLADLGKNASAFNMKTGKN